MLSSKNSGSAADLVKDKWLGSLLSTSHIGGANGRVQAFTIQAFKGLERPAVILTDLEDAPEDLFRALTYVGATRATDRLSIVGARDKLAKRVGPS